MNFTWESLRDLQGLSKPGIALCILVPVHFLFYYVYGWILILFDWNNIFCHYAIRSGPRRLPPMSDQIMVIKESTIDLCIVKPVLIYVIFSYLENYIDFGEIPSAFICFSQWAGLSFIFSTSLYWIHRALHEIPFLYINVHKKHHEFHSTVGFASQYSDFVESICSFLHVLFGILIIKPHFVCFSVFYATTVLEIVDAHGGYDVPWRFLFPWSDYYPWGSGARLHDYHHSHNIGTYGGGVFGVWDKLLGTDKSFRLFEIKRLKR